MGPSFRITASFPIPRYLITVKLITVPTGPVNQSDWILGACDRDKGEGNPPWGYIPWIEPDFGGLLPDWQNPYIKRRRNSLQCRLSIVNCIEYQVMCEHTETVIKLMMADLVIGPFSFCESLW